jgi:DNA replication protein
MNEQWYKETYVDRIAWILENSQNLSISVYELAVLLQIEYLNRKKAEISLQILAFCLNDDSSKIDETCTRLRAKGYLDIHIDDHEVHYITDGVFLPKTLLLEETKDIYGLFEREFKRPLSHNEIDKLNDWLTRMDVQYLMYALREAILYNKLQFSYIDRILNQWLKDHVSIEDIIHGKR